MNPTLVKSIEQFEIAGPVGVPLAIALGVALAALFAWLLRREAGVLGGRSAVFFWCLRTAAVAVVLWMLLAPMIVRVETTTSRRAIAIVADVSGSMQTVDPHEDSDELRWDLSRLKDEASPVLAAADRAVAALGMARAHLHSADDALRQHSRESLVIDSVKEADAALERVRGHLQRIIDAAGEDGSQDEIARNADQLLARLAGSEFQSFSQLSKALQSGKTPPQRGWRESLPDLIHRVAGIGGGLETLARSAADAETRRRSDAATEAPVDVPVDRGNDTRLGRVAGWIAALQGNVLAPLRDEADVRLSTFDESLRWVPGEALPVPDSGTASSPATPGSTDLSTVLEALQRERQERSLAAVFLVSDFAHNKYGGKSPLDVAAALAGTPVYSVPIGNTQHVRDVQLQDVFAPAVAMRNDDIVIEARLRAYDCEGEVCVVTLLKDGDVVDSRQVTIDSAFASRTVRFESHVPEVGIERYAVSLEPVAGELSEDNNQRSFEVNVTRSEIRILLADEMPRWEYRYLSQLFRRDPKVECDELLFRPRMIATGRRQETQALPLSVDEWDQYDVVLLGDLSPERFPAAAQKSLIECIQQRSTTLVLIAGTEAMPQLYADDPLGDVLPVLAVDEGSPMDPAGYLFRVTEEGRDHPALMIGETSEESRIAWDFVNRSSPLATVSAWRRPRASAHTLIAADPRSDAGLDDGESSSAFLCWHPLGRGRVVYLSGPESYRLRFLRGDRLHYRFWGQLLRWAIASELSGGTKFVRVQTDKSRYEVREAVHVRLRLTDEEGAPIVAEDVMARVTRDGFERTVPLARNPQSPGEYTGEIHGLSPGDYRLEPIGEAVDQARPELTQAPLETASARFTVERDPPGELIDTRCDRALARQIADITGGQIVPPTAVDEILRLTNLEPEVSESIEHRPLWLRWRYLWIVFGCLQSEWIIRKWLGMS